MTDVHSPAQHVANSLTQYTPRNDRPVRCASHGLPVSAARSQPAWFTRSGTPGSRQNHLCEWLLLASAQLPLWTCPPGKQRGILGKKTERYRHTRSPQSPTIAKTGLAGADRLGMLDQITGPETDASTGKISDRLKPPATNLPGGNRCRISEHPQRARAAAEKEFEVSR